MLRLVTKGYVSLNDLDEISPNAVFDLNEYLDIIDEAERKAAKKMKDKAKR